MSRRRRAEKRPIEKDSRYSSELITKLINRVMLDGKKSTARTIVYGALEKFAKKVNQENTLVAFEQALENAMPLLEVKSKRIGGATYQVPCEISPERRISMGMKWIITSARSKSGRSMQDGLSMELADCFQNQGSTIKKKDDTHRMAEANKAFASLK
ncbi:MAG: 30S ribosomal protein S7 [Chlamydiia bacterium]|nr:30S ribosomal protein S7 [Chlamydiia bacterium]MCP5509633.1 30S ribosomal protein S7 [Chlamydiales bacterium]HPE84879.1 30S ribosomal protein S7 [Chlamydiales bacterium]